MLLRIEQTVQVCDATKFNNSNTARQIKNTINTFETWKT